ncbi:MAG: zinc ribbon domain-containing protein [Sandaracinaceae bacterium]
MSAGPGPTAVPAPCARCGTPLEVGDLRCAICSLPAPASEAGPAQALAEVLRCEGCGAALEYDVEVRAPRCAFCGSVAHLERSEDPLERAEAFLPFRVDAFRAQAALKDWLSRRGFFAPSRLAEAQVASLTPLWFVGWTFDAEALVSWTADSDHGARRSRWAPHAGQSPLTLRSVLVSASRGLSAEETAKLAPRYDLSTARAAPHAMPGAVIERFDVQRSAARATVAEAVRASAMGHAKHWVPGRRLRHLKTAVLLRRLVTRRLAFPTYVLAYRFQDRLYRALVHGQDASLVFGTWPFSWTRLALVVLAVLFVLLFVLVGVFGLLALAS